MDTEREKKGIEAHMGDWLRKYDDLERRLELVRRILSEYPRHVRARIGVIFPIPSCFQIHRNSISSRFFPFDGRTWDSLSHRI
jgi:hypothetical protein